MSPRERRKVSIRSRSILRPNPVRRINRPAPLNHNAVRAVLQELRTETPPDWDDREPPRPLRASTAPTWFDQEFASYAKALARAQHK